MLALVRRALAQLGFLRGPIPYILAGSKSNVTVTRNSTNTTGTGGVDDDEEVTLRTIVIPAGTLKGNASAFIYGLFRVTNSGSTKQILIRANGTGIGTISTTTAIANQLALFLHADNSAGVQKAANNASGAFNGSASAMLDITLDNTQPITLTLTCKWTAAVASEQIKHESSMVWIFPET